MTVYNPTPMPIIPSGGMKSWFFTKTASDVALMYKATIIFPPGGIQTITTIAVKNTETVIAEFLTEIQTTAYSVLDGTRFMYITAKTDNNHLDITLRGKIYLTDINGANPTLLRTTNYSIPLTEIDANYEVNAYGGALNIPTTTRVKFVVTATNTHNVNHDVTISVEDDTFSRLDVPSPVGVTDLSGYLRLDQTINQQTVLGELKAGQFNATGYGTYNFYGAGNSSFGSITTPDIYGGSGTSSALNLEGTTSVLKTGSFVCLQPFGGNVGVGLSSPTTLFSVNGVISSATGTALLPAYTVIGDLNTGLWFPASDTIAYSTAGSERLRITSAGNIGIGVTTSTSRVTIDYATAGDVNWLDFKTQTSTIMQLRYYVVTPGFPEFEFYNPNANSGMNFKTASGGFRIVPWTIGGADIMYFQSINKDMSFSLSGGTNGDNLTFNFNTTRFYKGNFGTSLPSITSANLNVLSTMSISNASSYLFFVLSGGTNYIQCGTDGTAGGQVTPVKFTGSQGYPELLHMDSTKMYTPLPLAVGHTTPSAELHVIATTEQLRVGYSTSLYWNATTAATTGVTTFTAIGGTTPSFVFSQAMTNSVSLTTPALKLTPSTPTTMSTDVNNYDLGNKSFIRLGGGAADRTITGIVAQADGHVLFITNIGTTNKISFANESASSTAANRIMTTFAGTVEIPPAHSIQLIYDATTARWRELSHL